MKVRGNNFKLWRPILVHEKQVFVTQEIEVAFHLDLDVGSKADEEASRDKEAEVEEENYVLEHVVAAVRHLFDWKQLTSGTKKRSSWL